MISQVTVVVPAADEQDRIGACLESILAARAELVTYRGAGLEVRIVVVLDACTDRTADVVTRFAGVQTVLSTARCVGAARALGAARAIESAGAIGLHELWLASTDADCRVPLHWLVTMVERADAGADLVLGTVRPGPGLPERVHAAWVELHELVPGHQHVHAANLAIRASSYVTIGGWRALRSHEDVDLLTRALADGGLQIERRADLPVLTSSRLRGRAPDGFAAFLRDLHEEVSEPF